jgi:Cof subfamily protein (haloacid dehalogenase superfamily)
MHEVSLIYPTSAFPYRLAAIDIDDTLVGPDKLVSEPNRRAVGLLRSLGVRVVLASGRNHDDMMPFHRLLGLDDYVVSANGALVRHGETDEVLFEHPVPDAEARAVIAEGLSLGVAIVCYGYDGIYVHGMDEWARLCRRDADTVGIRAVDLSAGPPEPSLLKVTWAADPGRMDALAAAAAERYAGRLGTCVTNPYYLEFAAPGADKAAGVGAVARRYGIEARQVLAFGDGNNDVALLRWAGLGIAMADGRPAARAAARRVGPPGDPETALARAIAAVTGHSGWEARVA